MWAVGVLKRALPYCFDRLLAGECKGMLKIVLSMRRLTHETWCLPRLAAGTVGPLVADSVLLSG